MLAWHLREARRREGSRVSQASWGGVLYFYLVALISLLIALGGAVAMLHAVRDSVMPLCYEVPGPVLPPVNGPVAGSGFEGEGSPIVIPDVPIDVDSPLLAPKQECYPSTSEALRSALDAGIVALVAGGAWLWHLRKGRRTVDGPPVGS